MTQRDFAATARNAAVSRGLPWIAAGLGTLYAMLVVAHLLIVPPPAGWILAGVAGVSALLLIGSFVVLRRRHAPPALAHPIVAVLGAIALANCVTHLFLVREAHHSLNFLALAIALGSCLQSRRWLAATLGANFGAWFALAWSSLGDPEWIHYGFGLVIVNVLAGVVHEVRMRTTARLETLRVRAEETGARLGEVLAQERREIVRRRQVEEELRLRQEALLGMNEILAQLTSHGAIVGGRIPEAFAAVTEAAVRWFGVDRAAVWIARDDRNRLVCEDSFDRRTNVHESGAVIDSDANPKAFRLLSENRTLIADDARTHPATRELLTEFIEPLGIRSLLAASIQYQGRAVGFVVLTRIREQQAWLPEEQIVAGSLADLIALALHARDQDRSTADLRTLTDELTRSNRDLEDFAHVASHDLQEPLRMVASYLQLLERRYGDQLDEKGKQYIRYAVDGAQRMRKLIDDLLSLSRSGRSTNLPEPVDLDPLLEGITRRLAFSLEEAGAELSIAPMPRVLGDRSQLEQLFQNLLGNALKYRGDNPCRIEVTATEADDAWKICVADNGIGFEPCQAERIFAPFQRLHGREQYEGTGIGLSIVRRVVERHGGRIQAISTPGAGATFELTLPRCDDETETKSEAPADASHSGSGADGSVR